MKRTNTIRLISTKEQKQIFGTIRDYCAALWNAVQYRCRHAFFKEKLMPSCETLYSEFKEHEAYKTLSTHVGQEVIKKARKTWNSFFACVRLRQKGELEIPPSLRGGRQSMIKVMLGLSCRAGEIRNNKPFLPGWLNELYVENLSVQLKQLGLTQSLLGPRKTPFLMLSDVMVMSW